ncbi:MAG: TRIC cation channel family protein [Sphingomonadaceae bacterium]|nr:TRIC cation channel family protein [Sphingomonadaceae bacterium]
MAGGGVQIAPALIAALDLFGIAVFAASGALAAARLRQTLVTFAFFALVTGVGGGTVRDLLIGAPVFWVQDWRFPAACLATALLVWVTPARIWSPRALDWFDAVGLAVYSVFGAWKSMSLGIDLLPAMMMGVITACVGGVIRDMLAGEPSILLRPEIYVTAAALASGSFVILLWLGVPLLLAALASAAAGFALRAAAIAKGLAIPAYKG